MIMKILLSACKKAVPPPPMVNFPLGITMDPFLPRNRKDKVVIVMGATGTGKSRLSIDLATKFAAEVVNSDKMQVYRGLDIATNKVTGDECRGVPHHLLGFVDPDAEFTAQDFKHHASLAVDSIVTNRRLPVIAGGSNSYIKALVHDDVDFRSRYDCCFLWVDVSLPVLHSFVSERVDRMVQAGLLDEVRRFFDPEFDGCSGGIRRAIGVAELDHFFRNGGDPAVLEEAIRLIKANTCGLATRQLRNITRLRNQLAWEMHRLDATEAFLKHGFEGDEAWERLVARPSTSIVRNFLNREIEELEKEQFVDFPKIMTAKPVMAAAITS